MGVIIGTASKVVDKFGGGLHGFTSGVPESGVPATQFSSDWADGVQQEINNVITAGDEESPDNSDRDQLSKSIDYQNRVTYPRSGSTATYYWRGHVTAGPGASYQNHRESGFKHNVADNTVQSMIGLAIPTNSQAQVILRGSLVRSNSMTVYGNCAFAASAPPWAIWTIPRVAPSASGTAGSTPATSAATFPTDALCSRDASMTA